MSDSNKPGQDRDQNLNDTIKETIKDVRETINDTIRETKDTFREETRDSRTNDSRADRFSERDKEWRRHNRVSDGLGAGVTFIFIGVIWMLFKLNYLDFSVIGAMIDLWPLIFIVIGVNIIFKRVPYVSLLTWTLFLSAIVGYGMYFAPNTYDSGVSVNLDEIFNEDSSKNWDYVDKTFPLKDYQAVTEGELNLDLGFGEIAVGATQSDLLSYNIPDRLVKATDKIDGNQAVFNFEMKKNLNLNGRNSINYDFFLNQDVNWMMNLNIGAGDTVMNLDSVKVKEVELNGGAGSFEMILGDKQEKCDVSVNMGAGDLTIDLPSNVGVEIINNGLINDVNFEEEGFKKMGDAYVNDEYGNSTQVISIEINSAISNIDVKWH